MDQIFKITVGQETIDGRLPALRIGQGYASRFHIFGVGSAEAAPKVWVGSAEDPEYWTSTWDSVIGGWIANVGTSPTEEAIGSTYAITLGGATEGAAEYIAGQGVFTVYANIASGEGISGETGVSLVGLIAALALRVTAIEAQMTELATIAAFDTGAFDSVMRTQVEAITNKLRAL